MAIETEADRNRHDVAAFRWRADLLDYDAALLDSIGKSAEADAKRLDAADRRKQADLIEAFQDAADAHGPRHPATEAAYAALDAARATRRTHLAVTGAPGIHAGQDDGIDEPNFGSES